MCRLNHLKPIISYRQLKKQRHWLVEISLLLILELLIQINLGAGTKKMNYPDTVRPVMIEFYQP